MTSTSLHGLVTLLHLEFALHRLQALSMRGWGWDAYGIPEIMYATGVVYLVFCFFLFYLLCINWEGTLLVR